MGCMMDAQAMMQLSKKELQLSREKKSRKQNRRKATMHFMKEKKLWKQAIENHGMERRDE